MNAYLPTDPRGGSILVSVGEETTTAPDIVVRRPERIEGHITLVGPHEASSNVKVIIYAKSRQAWARWEAIATTSESGDWIAHLAPGDYMLYAKRVGFNPIGTSNVLPLTVERGAVQAVSIPMTQARSKGSVRAVGSRTGAATRFKMRMVDQNGERLPSHGSWRQWSYEQDISAIPSGFYGIEVEIPGGRVFESKIELVSGADSQLTIDVDSH